MALATPCQTSGAQFHVYVGEIGVMVAVDMPIDKKLDLTEAEAKTLEANLHNAVELVLAPHFK